MHGSKIVFVIFFCILIPWLLASCGEDLPCTNHNNCGTTYFPEIGLSLTTSCNMAKCRNGKTGGCNCPTDPNDTDEKLTLEK